MLLLKNARIYPQTEAAPFTGDVLCKDGRIIEIGKDLNSENAEVLDLTGLVLMPGWVDCHSHAGLGPGKSVLGLSYGSCQSSDESYLFGRSVKSMFFICLEEWDYDTGNYPGEQRYY